MPTTFETLVLVQRAHAGQVDRLGRPYWEHPARVAKRLGPDATETERQVALLHDVLEDTRYTAAALRAMGYTDAVVAAVEALTRREGETYAAFVDRAATNELARKVKAADLEDNLDPARAAGLPEGYRAKYEGALARLKNV